MHWLSSLLPWWQLDIGVHSFYEWYGDTFLAELRAIQFEIGTCYDLGYTNIIFEGGCPEAIDLIHNVPNASLHVYASILI